MDDIVKKEPASMSTPREELEYRLLTETDTEEIQNIIDLFKFDIQKRNVLRTGKISDLQDKIYTQIAKRVEVHPDEFSNKDLLDYFKVMQDTISKSDDTLEGIDTPKIQINQNQLNINMESENSLSQESKKRVMEAVRNVIKQAQLDTSLEDLTYDSTSDIINSEFVEVPNDVEENN